MKNIAVVIPTYNELENIERLVKEIKKNIKTCTIFIVDDTKNENIGKLIIKKKLKLSIFIGKKNLAGVLQLFMD